MWGKIKRWFESFIDKIKRYLDVVCDKAKKKTFKEKR